MKVAVLNLSGNTGKTTLSKHLLVPLLGAQRIEIEDVNTGDGQADTELAATKFQTLAAELNVADDDESFVIDIGASNAKLMLEHFAQLKITRRAIDFWVIPTVASSKQKADSLNTAKKLMGIGVPASQIVMIINNVDDVDAMEDDFAPILSARAIGLHVADQVVLSSEAFEMLKGQNESVFDLANNPPDFKKLKISAKKAGPDALAALGRRMVLQDLAEAAADNLKAVFKSTPLAALVQERV